jgi:hypothetical protein
MGNLKNMKYYILIPIICLISQVSCAQEKIDKRTVLNKYDNGQTMREHIKYQNNDTLVEFVYFENGQINYKRQVVNNQRNGWSYTYNEKGELIFQENYLNNKLSDDFYCYYPSGQISRIEHYKNNKNIDTTTYFDEDGQVIRTIAFLSPCEFGSRECNQFVTIFENDSKVYGFRVEQGIKSKNHEIYNQAVYDKLMAQEKQIPLHEKGKMIFQNNCGMCHKLDKPLIGPALSCITNTKSTEDLKKLIGGENGHPTSKLTEEEINALIEYINKNCP